MPLRPRAAFAGALLAFAMTVAPVAFSPAAETPDTLRFGAEVSEFTLANGLEVIVIPDHRAPVVTHMVWYKVGSADEPEGKSGIAHFLEHLMFKGTEAHPEGEFSRVVAAIGGEENAFTTTDYTAYFQRVAREHLPTVMLFEADRMANLVLSDDKVRPELQVVLEERRMRIDNDPSARLGEVVQASLFMNHPYRKPVIGWRPEIERLTREDALAFYNRYYTPNNAILIVAGDVKADEVRALAEETYGKVARRAAPGARRRPVEPEPIAARDATLHDARVQQPNLRRYYLAPSYRTGKPGEAEALDIAAEMLGGGATSLLYRELVIEKHVATSVAAWYRGTDYDDASFGIYAVPRPGVSLEALAQAVDEAMQRFLAAEPDAQEVGRVKDRLVAELIYSQDSQAMLARLYGTALATGLSVKDVAEWPSRVMAVPAAKVLSVARAFLKPERSVTGYLQKAVLQGRS